MFSLSVFMMEVQVCLNYHSTETKGERVNAAYGGMENLTANFDCQWILTVQVQQIFLVETFIIIAGESCRSLSKSLLITCSIGKWHPAF